MTNKISFASIFNMTLNDYLKTTTQAALARKIGVSQGMVYQWLHGIRPISALSARAIEEATGGLVSKVELRPDIFDSRKTA